MVYPKRSSARQSPTKTKDAPTTAKRSPSRTRSPSRQKSPSRIKSETREKSPSRRKSSGTVTKSAQRSGKLTPTRRSPIRKVGGPLNFSDDDLKSTPQVTKRSKVMDIETKVDSDDATAQIKQKSRSSSRTRTKNSILTKLQDNQEREISVESNSSTISRRVTRLSQSRERIVQLKPFNSLATTVSEFSDEEEKPPSKLDINHTTHSYGSVALLFLMMTVPVAFLIFISQCTQHMCTFKNLENLKLRHIGFYELFNSFLIYLLYFLFITLLSLLPWGIKVSNIPDKQEKRIYRMNGLINLFIVILVVLVIESQHIPFIDFVLKNFLYLYISALAVGLGISGLAYIRSFYVPITTLNPHIINKGKIYNFFVGRELHPRVWGLDWKLLVIRNSIITKFLLDLCLLGDKLEIYTDFAEKTFNVNLNNLTPSFIVYFALSAVSALDGLIFEYTRVTTKELQQEAFGYYMGVRYFIEPFIACLTTKYILDHNISLPYWELGLVTSIFLIGYLIYRSSNNQKDSFRKNPYSPTFSNLETLPTTQGKKLLCSGFWGLARHPNYLGHILIELSVVPLILKSPLFFIILLKVIFLIHRAIRDNNHCKLRYGTAWDRYCNKVRYYLIPKVF